MTLFRLLRRFFYTAFREIFIYHHSALEFRAKIYAFFIVSPGEAYEQYAKLLEEIASEVYDDAPDRAAAMTMMVKEYSMAVFGKKNLSSDQLLKEINLQLKAVPRYALKIEIDHLRRLQSATHAHDNQIYQDRIIVFFDTKRKEYENRGNG